MISSDSATFLLMGLNRNEKKIQRILKAIDNRKHVSDILDDLVQIWLSQEGCHKKLTDNFLIDDTEDTDSEEQPLTASISESEELIIDQLFVISKSLDKSITYVDTRLANTDEKEELTDEEVTHFWECLYLFAHAINDTNSDIIKFIEDNTDE